MTKSSSNPAKPANPNSALTSGFSNPNAPQKPTTPAQKPPVAPFPATSGANSQGNSSSSFSNSGATSQAGASAQNENSHNNTPTAPDVAPFGEGLGDVLQTEGNAPSILAATSQEAVQAPSNQALNEDFKVEGGEENNPQTQAKQNLTPQQKAQQQAQLQKLMEQMQKQQQQKSLPSEQEEVPSTDTPSLGSHQGGGYVPQTQEQPSDKPSHSSFELWCPQQKEQKPSRSK